MAQARNLAIAGIGIVVVAVAGYLVVQHLPHGGPATGAPAAPPPAAPASPAPQAPQAQPAPLSANAAAECILPGPPPVIPNGAYATAADMRLGHTAVQGFVNNLEAYQGCLNDKVDHPAPGMTDEQKAELINRGNAAVDQAHAFADAYGAQLKLFHSRNPGAK